MFRRNRVRESAASTTFFLLEPLLCGCRGCRKSRRKRGRWRPSGRPSYGAEACPYRFARFVQGAGRGGDETRSERRHLPQEAGGRMVHQVPRARRRGREWVAKIGKEAQSETAAVRLVWAAGYLTEINYLAPCVRIEGAPRPAKTTSGARAAASATSASRRGPKASSASTSGSGSRTLSRGRASLTASSS